MIDPAIVRRVHLLVNKHRREIGLKPWKFKDVPQAKWSDIIYALLHFDIGERRIIRLPLGGTPNQMRSMIHVSTVTMMFKWKVRDMRNGSVEISKVCRW